LSDSSAGLEAERRLDGIRNVILVGSGKGGVGKSFVACGLALGLSRKGHETALLDLDIHGASIPRYLGVGPPVRSGRDGLEPKAVERLKVMSVGLFTGGNAVAMRGGEKQDLITQMFALTNWGRLDYLVVDLPPSMSDELFTAFSLFAGKSSLILVTTPSRYGTDVVLRMRRLAETENVAVLGSVLNMAYIQDGATRAHPFGKANTLRLGEELKSAVLAEIPLMPGVNSGKLRDVLNGRNEVSRAFEKIMTSVLQWRRKKAAVS
jgi:ATP-binding protein involved in chromosome partitioning